MDKNSIKKKSQEILKFQTSMEGILHIILKLWNFCESFGGKST